MSCCSLSQDVLIEILSRLSVKTLMRFKCVCKSWSALIQNPIFTSTHLNRAICTNQNNNLVIIHQDHYSREDVCTMFQNEKPDVSVKLRLSPKKQCYILVMGPCNGLFCMYDYLDDLYLCNPATREIRCLPKSTIAPPPRHIITRDQFGFGFDPKTKDYKVIRLLRCSKDKCEYQIELYTLSTNSWRKINVPVQAFLHEHHAAAMYFNGVYHWWAVPMSATKYSKYDYSEYAFVSFDMASECFETTPLPDEHVGGTFAVYKESLAMILCYFGETGKLFNLWTTNEYGMKVCWTKLLTIGPLEGVENRALGIWKNNEFLLLDDIPDFHKQVISYNSKNQILRILMFDNARDSCVKIGKYTESLVSIKGTN